MNNIIAANLWKACLSLKNKDDIVINKIPLPLIVVISLNALYIFTGNAFGYKEYIIIKNTKKEL